MVNKRAAKEIELAWQTLPYHIPGGQIEQACKQTSAPGLSKKIGEKWGGGEQKKKRGGGVTGK